MPQVWELPDRTVMDPSDFDLVGSCAWVCKHCGEVYARRRIQSTKSFWHATIGLCKNCPPHPADEHPPGSLNTVHGPAFRDRLVIYPLEVLNYELQCELDFLESPYYRRRFR